MSQPVASSKSETATLPPPFHTIPNVPNFRDIGGWRICPPQSTGSFLVRKSLVFRGADPTRIAPSGIAKLLDLGIAKDYDLRSPTQIARLGGEKGMHGIERVSVPLFEGEDGEDEEVATKRRYELYAAEGTDGIVEAFIAILLSSAAAFRAILLPFLNQPTPPARHAAIFLHCTTGNNRTGALIAIFLALLHVPYRIIAEEYALSDPGMAQTRHINVNRLLAKGAFAGFDEAERRRKCERMLTARKESVVALLKEVERRWGGAEGFFREVVEFSETEIEGIRKCFTMQEMADYELR
ncbi:unnamed protein product [Periconia digitata]|uniref:Tyrosine specific protein phosphatases domain-containing protein n=1 Tax=Periconia digitata TaxID=1303443 RepID=A0A9W4U4U5_9PLEO|nr:unnamed protein product [Periconia digitata]